MKTQKTDYQLFREWIGTWQVQEYPVKKVQVIEACMINVHRFNNLRAGKVALNQLEKREINKLAGVEIFKTQANGTL